jgi:hypothetical protein
MTDVAKKTGGSDKPEKAGLPSWTGKAALAGAAIGSAAIAAALLYASRRKERLAKEKAARIEAEDNYDGESWEEAE